MILFPLMTAWMGFRIFKTSPLPVSGHFVEETSDADVPAGPECPLKESNMTHCISTAPRRRRYSSIAAAPWRATSPRLVITRPKSCDPWPRRGAPTIGGTGSCTSATISLTSSSLFPSLSFSGSRIERTISLLPCDR